jgi:hypothetical protein
MPSLDQMRGAGVSNPYDYFDQQDGKDAKGKGALQQTGYAAAAPQFADTNPLYERVAVMCTYFDEALKR